MTGFIVFAHGSSIESANEAVRSVAAEMARRGQLRHVIAAFLEGGKPNLQTAASDLAQRGVNRIIVIPYFLTLGLHLQRDLPKFIEQAAAANPEIAFDVTSPLDGHPAMVDALLDRARAPVCSPD